MMPAWPVLFTPPMEQQAGAIRVHTQPGFISSMCSEGRSVARVGPIDVPSTDAS
jgi:hypothetical protein